MGSPRLCYGSLQPSPDTLTRFKGPTSKGRERRELKGREMGGEVRLPHSKFLDPPLIWTVGVVNLVLLACRLRTTTKKVVNFYEEEKCTSEKILATPMIEIV